MRRYSCTERLTNQFELGNYIMSNVTYIDREFSARFDEEVAPMILETYDADDSIAFNESFNDWTDSLCKDGDISQDVRNNVCYVGKYSGEE
jgi:hypothetical protein